MATTVEPIEGLHIVGRSPVRLSDQRMVRDQLQTIRADAHALEVAYDHLIFWVFNELLDARLLAGTAG